MTRFPNFTQYDSMDCGPTCLKMISLHYEKDVSIVYLRNLCCAIQPVPWGHKKIEDKNFEDKNFARFRNCCTFAPQFTPHKGCGAAQEGAFSSAGSEHLPYKQRVGGSNPSTPTTTRERERELERRFQALFFRLAAMHATGRSSARADKKQLNC